MKRSFLATVFAASTLMVTAPISEAAPSTLTPDQLSVPKSLSVTGLAGNHNLVAYPVALFNSATVDGTKLVSYDAGTPGAMVNVIKSTVPTTDANPGLYALRTLTGGEDGTLRTWVDKMATQTLSGGTPLTMNGTSASATLAPGAYLIVDKNTSGAACLPMFTATSVGPATTMGSLKLGEVECKKITPEAPIKAVADDVASGSNFVFTDNLTPVGSDELIRYRLRQRIPNHTSFSKFQIKITDKFSQYVTYRGNPVITIRNGTNPDQAPIATLTAQDFTVEQGTNRVSFLLKDVKPYESGTIIDVEYDMHLTPTAPVLTEIPNRVESQFTNNPNYIEIGTEEENPPVPGNEVKVKTFKLGLKKINMDSGDLTGATFKLEKLSKSSRTIKIKDNRASDDAAASETISVGSVVIDGLDAGEYRLTELTPPQGYSSVALPKVEFTLGADGRVVEKSSTDINKLVDVDKDGFTLVVKNPRSITELPNTGLYSLIAIAITSVLLLAMGVWTVKGAPRASEEGIDESTSSV